MYNEIYKLWLKEIRLNWIVHIQGLEDLILLICQYDTKWSDSMQSLLKSQ